MGRKSLSFIWKIQKEIPVALRRTGNRERVRVKLPYSDDNRHWLQNNRRFNPIRTPATEEQPAYWEIPKSWFNDFIDRSLMRYGRVYIVQPHCEQEICSPSCRNAKRHECECQCMGEHHGAGDDGSWFDISDAFSTRVRDRKVACRLLTSRGAMPTRGRPIICEQVV